MQVREFDPGSLDKMLPCPFCGGEAELDTAQSYRAMNGHFGNRVVVYCADCGADQGTCVEDVPDIHPNEVIEQWNKRAALPPRDELLREALTALDELISMYSGVCSSLPFGVTSNAETERDLRRARAAADKIRAAVGGEKP